MKKPVADAVKIADISKTSKIEAPVAPTGMPPKPPMPIKLKLKKAQAPATVSPVEIKETITDEIKEGTAPKSIKLKLKKATPSVEIKEEIKEEAPAPKSIKLNLKKAEEEKSAKYEIIPLVKSKPASEIFKVNPKTTKIRTLKDLYLRHDDYDLTSRLINFVFKRQSAEAPLYDTPEGIYLFLNSYILYISHEQDVKEMAVPLPEDYLMPEAKKIVKQYVQDVFPENDLFTVSIVPFNKSKWDATRKSGGISGTTVARYNTGKDMLLFTPTEKGEKDRKERIENSDAGFWTILGDYIIKYGRKAGYED